MSTSSGETGTTTAKTSESRAWADKIQDPTEHTVFAALADLSWDFRTLEGIARSTGLPKSQVADIMAKYPDLIRKSSVPDRNGRELFTLRSRPVTSKEAMAEIRSFVTKSV